jgi:hypothetical protein
MKDFLKKAKQNQRPLQKSNNKTKKEKPASQCKASLCEVFTGV